MTAKKKLMQSFGCSKKDVSQLGGLKLIQGIANIFKQLNKDFEDASALITSADNICWRKKNEAMAPLFINNDLRIADAHETIGESIIALENLGFDSKTVHDGYGSALDYVLDDVIDAIKAINSNIMDVLNR